MQLGTSGLSLVRLHGPMGCHMQYQISCQLRLRHISGEVKRTRMVVTSCDWRHI